MDKIPVINVPYPPELTVEQMDKINVPYPPELTVEEILRMRSTNKLGPRAPNRFFLYRLAYLKELRKRISSSIPMTKVSPYISLSWSKESIIVKDTYKELSDQVEDRLKEMREKNKLALIPEKFPESSSSSYGSDANFVNTYHDNGIQISQNFTDFVDPLCYNSLFSEKFPESLQQSLHPQFPLHNSLFSEEFPESLQQSMHPQFLRHNINDNNSENSIFLSGALEARLCELYVKDDVIDIFWGRLVEDRSTKWNIYVITRGLYYPHAKTEIFEDDQVINFIAEKERFFISNTSNDPLPSSINIPRELKEIFDKALDNELGLLFREAHYNLVGIGTGYKQTRGQFTETPAIIFYVRQKGILRRGCGGLFPKEICGFQTDVIEACVAMPCAGFGIDTCRRHQQNVRLGSSIGMGSNENQNTTGTISAIAYENNSPNRIGIISCEHVLKFNESDPREKITIYQPSYNDQFESRRKLRELLELSQELGENTYINDINDIDDINIMREKLRIAENQDSKLATYVKGKRENFLSKSDNKKYGVDAGFCVFDNENRRLYSKNFSIPSSYFKEAGLPTCLEGTYTYDELKKFNYNQNRVFKVGRTTGLTLGQLLPTDQAIACNLTIESIKNAKHLEREKHIPCYDNADQKIFIGYMKSQLDSEIRQKRKKCYPIVWFDRQLAFNFETGDFDNGDSGASIIDETGKALGILHAKWITPFQTFGIASPYFAILEALDVGIYLSHDLIPPSVISSKS